MTTQEIDRELMQLIARAAELRERSVAVRTEAERVKARLAHLAALLNISDELGEAVRS